MVCGSIGLMAAAALSLLALIFPGREPTKLSSPRVAMKTFSSCDHLTASLNLWPGSDSTAYVQLSSRYNSYWGWRTPWLMTNAVMPGAAGPGAAGGAAGETGGSSADSYSQTNVQVEGIDESDLVKNDGKYIYSVGGSQLVVIRAFPTDARAVLSRTDVNAGADSADGSYAMFAAEELLLSGSKLVLFAAAQAESGGRSFAALLAQVKRHL